MITKVMGEAPFQVLTNNFSISPSNEGYTLQISADGENYSNLFQVGANVTRLVTGVAANSYYRLLGNQSAVSINWMKTCVTEGGGGASGTELQPINEFPIDAPEGTVVAYTGSSSANGVYQYDGTDWIPVGVDDLSDYWTSAQTESAITLAVSGKADASNVEANTGTTVISGLYFPTWNEQGVITGAKMNKYGIKELRINGARNRIVTNDNLDFGNIWVPVSAGTAGQILKSTGGVPEWIDNNFLTSADTQNFITSADTANFITSAYVEDQHYITSAYTGFTPIADFNALSGIVQEQQTVFSSGYNELHTQVLELSARTVDLSGYYTSAQTNTAISAATQYMVNSTSVDTIWKGSQAEYDALTDSGSTADPSTFYIII